MAYPRGLRGPGAPHTPRTTLFHAVYDAKYEQRRGAAVFMCCFFLVLLSCVFLWCCFLVMLPSGTVSGATSFWNLCFQVLLVLTVAVRCRLFRNPAGLLLEHEQKPLSALKVNWTSDMSTFNLQAVFFRDQDTCSSSSSLSSHFLLSHFYHKLWMLLIKGSNLKEFLFEGHISSP